MRLSRKYIRKLIVEEFKLLLEEEGDEEVTEEDPAAEEEGGDEAMTEEDPAEEEEEEEIEVDAEEEATLSKSADDQILAHIIDFETKAIKSASLVKDDELRPDPDGAPIDIEMAAESRWYKGPLRNMLFEEEEKKDPTKPTWVGSPDIDIARFSADTARLVMNYDSLIDMEALIINKASSYLLDQYDQETASYFEELMDVEHDMRSAEHPNIDDQNEVPESPPAVGSGFASQAGGGA